MQIDTITKNRPDGVTDISLSIEQGLTSHLLGYIGPSEAIAASARDDHIHVELDAGVIGVVAKILTHPDLRRQGIGSALLSRFVDICLERRATAIYLYASSSDDGYDIERNTFEPFDVVSWYERRDFTRLDAEDEPVMRQRLG